MLLEPYCFCWVSHDSLRRGGEIRTPDHGVGDRCLSHLATPLYVVIFTAFTAFTAFTFNLPL